MEIAAFDDQLVNYYDIVIYCRLIIWFNNKSWRDQASIKSFKPDDASMRRRAMSASVQMTWSPKDTKPLSEPIMAYNQLGPWK